MSGSEDSALIYDLWVEASYGDTERVQQLLAAGAAIEYREYHRDSTPLTTAAANGHTAAAQVLLKNGANLSAADRDYGATPLHWAACLGHEDVLELLLEHGAEISSRGNTGATPLHEAIRVCPVRDLTVERSRRVCPVRDLTVERKEGRDLCGKLSWGSCLPLTECVQYTI